MAFLYDSMYKIVDLQLCDAERVQQLLDSCSDYYELHEGCVTPPDAGAYELSAVPPTRSASDLLVVGLEDLSGRVTALIQILRGYPADDIWWIGLLVVSPELRGEGLGRELLTHVCDAAVAALVPELQLAVSVNNSRAEKFWRGAGFVDTGRLCDITARNGHSDRVRIMRRALAAA